MNHDDASLWPVQIVQDRYGGTYSGAAWLACAGMGVSLMETDAHGGDGRCAAFWCLPCTKIVGRGASPESAMADMHKRLDGVSRPEFEQHIYDLVQNAKERM